MTPELIELGKRAVACKGWRWMPGMRTLGDWRITNIDSDGIEVVTDASEVVLFCDGKLPPGSSSLPDLSDPATLGCLLALVREAWGDECAFVLPIDYGPAGVMWVARLTAGGRSLTQRHWLTEAEALVAALEAAPAPRSLE